MKINKEKANKEYFFILYLKKVYSEEANDKVQFINSVEKENIPKCILTKERDESIVKIFKFNPKSTIDIKYKLEFFYDGKKYDLSLEKSRDKTFLFDIDATVQNSKKKFDQTKLDITEKMNYFDEALSIQKEYDKMNILYNDSINLCNKKPSLQFLINIFVKIYNTELCSKLLDIFNTKIDKLVEDNNKEKLLKFKFDFDQIVENRDDIVSKFGLNSIYFYGLIFCYLNICNKEKFKELFEKLSTKEEGKKIVFEIMSKYKLLFKKKIDIGNDLLNEFIKYATKKEFKIFKDDALFYLKDINIFLEIMENNKDDIIKIKHFEPIEVLKITDDEDIKFGIINPKIEEITNFSKEKKKLLLNLNEKFWESLAKKSSGISRDNIEICSTLKKIFINYYNMVKEILPEKDIIRKEKKQTYNKGIFTRQIDKIIKEYIANNQDINNKDIIELIRDYDDYYQNTAYIRKRDPKILEKIDLEKIKIELDKKNENFIKIFKEMQFEKIFEQDLNNYLLVITNKIKKISDFDIIFKLVNINALGNLKEKYLSTLKNKYDIVAKEIISSENDENLIKSLVNLTTYICINENKIEFLETKINKSKYINQNIKHKLYIGLINVCKENKGETFQKINNFIMKYYNGSLKPEKLKEFIDFIINLSEDDSNNFIENIDNKYNIIEKEFYSIGINLNIQLLNELLIKNKLIFNEDNKYIKTNIRTISKIANDIEFKEIQFEHLKNFVNDDKEIVKEKLNLLTLAPNYSSDQEEQYENFLKYYKEMKDDLDKLSLYKNTLELYHSQIKKEEISNISKNIEIIQKETFSNYYNNTKGVIQTLFDESQNIVKDIEDVKKSKIFKIFFQKENKNNNNDKTTTNPFDKAYEEFTKFKKLLINKGTNIIKDSQDDIIKKIKEQYKDDKEIQNELTSLMSGEQQNEEEVMIYLKCQNIEKDLNSIFDFFSYFKNNDNLKRELDEWTEKCKDLSNEQDNSKIQTILNELKKAGIYDYKNNIDTKCNYIIFFNLFYENKQALAFLDQNTAEDIKPLYDKIVPGSDLTINNISDTINCVGFFQELKKIEGGLKEIIDHIKTKLNEKDLSILQGFKRYLEIYRSVNELNENFDFAQSIYKEINEIINESKFIFNKNNDELNVIINRDEGNINYKIITFDKIRELKNKIQLKQEGKKDSLYDANSNNYIKRYEKLKFFKDLTVNIEEIHELMTVLRTKGSTLTISITVDISYPDVYYILGGKKRDFKDIHEFLSKAKTNIINKLDSIYKDMTTIRFLYGKQIDSILNHIQGSSKINSFLRYILNFTDSKEVKEGKKSSVRKTMDYINETNNFNTDSFNIIHDYIMSLFNENKTSIKNHYKKISIKEGNDLKGIYTFFSKSDSLEEDILKIYLDKVGKIPIAQNILINSKETSYEEMQAFFHRAILCEYNALFIVELNGSFSPYQQRCMNIFLDKILTFKNNEYNNKNVDNHVDKSNTSSYMESCLVFIYNKNDDSFLNELKPFNPKILKINKIYPSLKGLTPRQSFSSINSIIFSPKTEDLYNNTHIIQSEICGLGKSTQIKNKIEESKKEYIYFPLGGNITKDIIYNKLDSIMNDINNKTQNNYNDIAIHLDLFDSKENIVSILNEFLFSFLITKFYSNNENVIFIPTNIEIYIEIPNSFKDFIINYGILKFFKRDDDMIVADDLPQLNLPKDKINLFKKMLGKDENREIYKWLKEKIKLARYSYHQIHIFINLFISQYNIFKGRKIYFSEYGKDVTDKCIDHFAEATKYFTYGGYSKLLLEKGDIQDNKNDEIDILSQVYKNDLENEKFDKQLIFIVKNKDNKYGNCLGIFYELDISTEALENGEALGKLNKNQKKEREEKKKSMSKEMFEKLEYLEIFKKILDLDNPLIPNENNENKLISLLEIIDKDDYVITTDNFRKMILILCRIIANIPVILMGETGCGKTALIKKLNKLVNNGIETLESINIDPGYDDNKLTLRMDDINKKAISCKGELWVFFDELNTCDSLSLITEIFINRTYGGKKLENDIRIIGACNPYRKKKENKNICGLTYKNNDDKNGVELVYLVNILPQSLMYYVFNFGSLAKENEDQYISSIISDIIPDPKLKNATKNVISECHEYLRKTFDPSVVSLREMKRFKKIYLFLLEYYENKKKLNPKKSGSEESIKLKSIIISIYVCYYIRLVDKTTRSNFDTQIHKSFKQLVNYKSSNQNDEKNSDYKKSDEIILEEEFKQDLIFNYGITDFNEFQFSKILSYEQDFILDSISLNKGIGKNTSLKENIFLLFIALATNIPLIIIGKPGSSKSLSAQLIYKEMGGKYSTKDFFKFYPSIIQTYFQGADSTKPKDVDDIFQKAEGRLKALKSSNNNELPISMILFDELGLAERSKYNPLKALHNNLEIDGSAKEGKEKGISFVGISNWTLDAAKINRALNLSVPDLDGDLDDLKITSISISESINDGFGSNKIFNKILPNVYYQFKENLKILQMLTVYKEYELQEYKELIDRYKEDEDFQNIFSDIQECKIFFEKKEPKNEELKKEKNEEEEHCTIIYEYNIFQKVKEKLKIFCESKKKESKDKKEIFSLFEESILSNNKYKRLLEKDKKVKLDFLGNRDFYFIVKGIAHEMNDNNLDYKNIIQKYIERNFGGFEITIDFEKDYAHLVEFQKYKDVKYKDFFEKISERTKWTSVQIFEIIYNIYCIRNDEADSLINDIFLMDINIWKILKKM